MNNRLIIAAAGSGKTTFLVNEALRDKGNNTNTLITTYTQTNEEEIRNRFIKVNRCVPKNVTIQTWFSLLIQHGLKPFQGHMGLFDFVCKGLLMVNSQSAKYVREDDIIKHYFSEDQKIYSDKLSKFVVKNNKNSCGAIVDRLTRIYSYIYIDEVQDLAGYDLELIKLFDKSNSEILLVGDPRQCTYVTNNAPKNRNFKGEKIISFFEDDSINIETDDSSFSINYRSHKEICDLSNRIFPGYKQTSSGNSKTTEHDGVFLVKKNKVEKYLSKYKAIQLCWDKRTEISPNNPVYNFGLSKGLEFDRVLIYPPKTFLDWLKGTNDLKPNSKSKFYVAITRAKYSVGIVCGDNDIFHDMKYWNE